MKSFKSLNPREKISYIGILVIYPLILLFEQVGKLVKFLNTRKRRITASVLTVCMLMTMFPVMSLTAFAETTESALPDTTMFVSKEQLMTLFDTNDTEGELGSAKVYFGDNNQKWWIAGSQNEDSIVLFAASPLATDVKFEDSDAEKNYDASWGCIYDTAPLSMYANHYGASDLRTTLQGLETSYFSAEEQALMNETIIDTNDTKNSSTYTTVDKLYAAYGDYSDYTYITIGKNSSGSLNSGLRVDKAYWNSGVNDSFWLRSPHDNYDSIALVAYSNYHVDYDRVMYGSASIVPAFELNLSSVLFGSAAPAATSSLATEGEKLEATANEFVLRYSGDNIGTATVNGKKSSVAITGVGDNTYLVVQDSNGAWAKKVTDGETVSASSISTGGTDNLTSYENCKVWLETTGEDRITYASEVVVETVKYLDENGVEQECSDFTVITSADTTLGADDGQEHWYVVDGEVTINSRITVIGNVHLILKDGCTLNATRGIAVHANNSLSIYSSSIGENMGTIVTNGYTQDYAAIGSALFIETGDITINGGNIIATSGIYAAAIGGGAGSSAGTVTINNGVVNAYALGAGSSGGAGIGAGNNCAKGTVNINGGTVFASSDSTGAGIGGGANPYGGATNNNTVVTITGGTVTATSNSASGIGGGHNSGSSDIIISGGSVKASSIGSNPTDGNGNNVYLLTGSAGGQVAVTIDGKEYAAIDGNYYVYLPSGVHIVTVGGTTTTYYIAADGTVSIAETCGAFVVAGGTKGTDYSYASNVLTVLTDIALTIANVDSTTATTTDRIEVASGVNANIIIAGVNIDVSGTDNAAAFKIASNSTGNVTITLADGTTNTLKSGENCAGLQKNGDASSGTLTITGKGALIATGGNKGAGIGSGGYSAYFGGSVAGSNITISGGTVTATGGINGAGIGGGYFGTGSDITISGGTVTATGGSYGAGIGGGDNKTGSDITISGGTVTATGGSYGAGIGGGVNSTGSDVTISGGTVTATGGNYGAGIGGGSSGTGTDITISGGSVKAVVGSDANTIGGGRYQAAVIPTNGTADVYLLTIENPNGETIYVDGAEYIPNKHDTETNVYTYLTGEAHTIKVGDNTFNYVFDDSDNTFKLSITENDAIINPTSAEYNGNEQKPTVTVTVGGVTLTENTDYTVVYSNNIDAVTATVTVTGTGSYTGTVTKNFDITKAAPVVANPTASSITYGQTLAASNLTGGWIWAEPSTVPTVDNDGYTAYYNILDTNNYDWSGVDGYNATYQRLERTVVVEVLDNVAPTGEISIGTNKWNNFFNKITFGLFFKKAEEVTIVAEDNETGVKEIAYYLSAEELTIDDIKALGKDKWTIYTDKFTIEPDKMYVIYARITDNSSNITYLNSDAAEFTDAEQYTSSYTVVFDGFEQKPTLEQLCEGLNVEISANDYVITEYGNNINATSDSKPAYARVKKIDGTEIVLIYFSISPYKLSNATLLKTVAKYDKDDSVLSGLLGIESEDGVYVIPGSDLALRKVSAWTEAVMQGNGYPARCFYMNSSIIDKSASGTYTHTSGNFGNETKYFIVSASDNFIIDDSSVQQGYWDYGLSQSNRNNKKNEVLNALSQVYYTCPDNMSIIIGDFETVDAVSFKCESFAYPDNVGESSDLNVTSSDGYTEVKKASCSLTSYTDDNGCKATYQVEIYFMPTDAYCIADNATAKFETEEWTKDYSVQFDMNSGWYKCSFEVEKVSQHDFTGDFDAYDENGHWHICGRGCSAVSEKEQHSFTNYTYNNDATYFENGTETATCDADGCLQKDTREAIGTKWVDSIAPTGEIKIGTNKWNSFLNTITFGLFFKETQTVTIQASDNESGVEKIEYYLASAKTDNFTGVDWTVYDGSFDINPENKYVVYAKITDKSGNETIICTNGIVLFKDIEITSCEYDYTLTTKTDIVTNIKPGNNTVVSIEYSGNCLQYSINSDGYLVLDGDSIENFAKEQYAGDYEFTIFYAALGELYSYRSSEGDEISRTKLNLHVKRCQVEKPTDDNTIFTYNGTEQTYTVAEHALYEVTNNKRTDAGNQTVTVALKDKNTYEWADGTTDDLTFKFEIGKKDLTVTANNHTIIYGDAPTNNGVVYSGFVNNDTDAVLDGTLDYDYSYIQYDNVGNNYTITPKGLTSDNYEISFVNGTLTVEQADPVITWPENLMGNAGEKLSTITLASGFTWDDDMVIIYSDNTYGMTYTPDDTINYNVLKKDIKVNGLDVTFPTAEITLKDNKWTKFWSNVTFNLFFKETQAVSITATDTESGVKEIAYYLSDEEISKHNLDGLEGSVWIVDDEFNINPEKKYIIYARITDNVGNVTYLNTDGIVLFKDTEVTTGKYDYTLTTKNDIVTNIKPGKNTVNMIDICEPNGSAGDMLEYTLNSDGYIVLKGESIENFVKNWNTGDYIVTITYNALGEAYVDGTSKSDKITDTVLTLTVKRCQLIKPTADNTVFTYNGNEQTYNIATSDYYEVTDNKRTNAGKQTVTVAIRDKKTYEWEDGTDKDLTFDFVINKANFTADVEQDGVLTYNGAEQSASIKTTESGVKGGQTVTFKYGISEDACNSNSVPAFKNADKYTVYFVATADNHNDVKGSFEVTIEQREISIDYIAMDNLVYDGTEKKPIVVVKDGDVVIPASEYTVDYTNNVNAGTATIIVTDNPGGNYIVNGTQNFTISKADPVITWPENLMGNAGEKLSNITLASGFTWDNADTVIVYSDNTYGMTYTPNDTINYNVLKKEIEVNGLDVAFPTAEISIKDNKWTQVLSNVIFDLFFKYTQEISITADDTESGVKEIAYYLSAEELSVDDVKALGADKWTVYTDKFTIQPDNKYVVYARITDNAGNITYLNSDGIVLDQTSPVITGIENDKDIYGDAAFIVDEDNLDTVTLDGEVLTAESGKYVIPADNKVHKVVVTDKSGNKIEYTLAVYKTYTITYMADGKEVSTEMVGYGKDATLPEVPEKDGYTGKWNADGKNITTDTTITAEYTKISDKVTQSPVTGDSSNTWLWVAVMFVSGASLFGIVIIKKARKKKMNI